MTPKEKQILIAQFRGSVFCRDPKCKIPGEHFHKGGVLSFLLSGYHNYFNDLNLVREVEALLKDEALLTYEFHLRQILDERNRVCDFSAYPSDCIWHLSAAQRTEALVRTIQHLQKDS